MPASAVVQFSGALCLAMAFESQFVQLPSYKSSPEKERFFVN
ncbi:MAG: hypothetical protein OXF41_18760 [bacterium]|nr:hypothetical protein [bacterium]